MRSTLPVTVFLVTAACAARDAAPAPANDPVPARRYEFLERPITAIDDCGDGVFAIAFDPMARSFAIHPEFSPDHEDLLAFARAAHADGRAVHATVWLRERVAKTPPPPPAGRWPFVIVRLADERDPRAERAAR